jgi:hypothetical protein
MVDYLLNDYNQHLDCMGLIRKYNASSLLPKADEHQVNEHDAIASQTRN